VKKNKGKNKSFIGKMGVTGHGNVMQRYIKQLLEKKNLSFVH